MPQRLSGSCVEAHQVAVIVSGKDQIPSGSNGSRPHRCWTWHRKLPAQFPGCGIDSPKIKLARTSIDQVMSGPPEAAICNWYLTGAVIELALLKRHDVEQPQV